MMSRQHMGGSGVRVEIVRHVPTKNCFLTVPDKWLKDWKPHRQQVPTVKLQWANGSKTGYFSCVTTSSGGKVGIAISSTMAQILGIKDGEEVILSWCCDSDSAQEVTMRPISKDDWEILTLNAESIQSSLMNQIRIVWPGQTIPVWISLSSCIYLQVVAVTPRTSFCLLEQFSEVNVLPPDPHLNNSSPEVLHNTTDMVTESERSNENEHFSTWMTSAFLHLLSPVNTLLSSLYDALPSLSTNKSDSTMTCEKCRNKDDVLERAFSDTLCFSVRVHPFPKNIPALNNGQEKLFVHPYNVFISENFFRKQEGLGLVKVPDRFLAQLRKIPYDAAERNVVVNVFILEKILEMCSPVVKEWAETNFLSSAVGAIFVSHTLRKSLGLTIGCRVMINNLTCDCVQTAQVVELCPLAQWKGNVENCLMDVLKSVRHLLVNSNSLITLSNQDFLLHLTPSHLKWSVLCPENLEFIKVKLGPVIDAGSPLCKDISAFGLPKVSSHRICPVNLENMLDDCLTYLHTGLCLDETSWQLFHGSSGSDNGNLLITGSQGAGKSTLVQTLCESLQESPHYVWCQLIDSTALKGKKPENILKRWEQVFHDAFYHQPSVVIMEDLDLLIPSAANPEEETMTDPHQIYYHRVAETLFEAMNKIPKPNRIVLMTTAKSKTSLHGAFQAKRGHVLFHKTVEIAPLEQEGREIFLEHMMQNLLQQRIDIDISKEVLRNCSRKMDGYVAHDLEMVIERSVLAMWKRKLEQKMDKSILQEDDFEEGLSGYVPTVLRGIDLHKSSDKKSWKDVGGLHDVKKALIEVFQWPTKYPELFSNCPLRLHSGILLYGTPGTGKTLLAGVVAQECGLNFISVKGPELLSKYIGASEQAVLDLFQRAQSVKPCIVFFDEFDSLAPRRGHDSTGVTDRVVNQLLTQLDGVEGLGSGIYVLAASSRPDLIDPALLRPGRIDRVIHCPLPNKNDRMEILHSLSCSLHLDEDVDFGYVAARTENFTGADLHALLFNSKLLAVHEILGTAEEDFVTDETLHQTTKAAKRVSRKVLKVSRRHVERALDNIHPSLKRDERRLYQKIYESFHNSRSRFGSTDALKKPRATLA